jgi:mxaA protein
MKLTSKLLLLLALLLTSTLISAETKLLTISKMTNPSKSTGIQIGDVLKRSITFQTTSPINLITKALPAKGTRNDELELIGSRVERLKEGDENKFKIELTYQVFTNISEPTVMALPSITFEISSAEQLIIPAWHFWFSPLVNKNITNAKANVQPQAKVTPIDLTQHKLLLNVFAIISFIGLIGLFYLNADAKWLPFVRGDFAQAHKQMKRLKKSKATDDKTLKDALLSLHEAFNKTYGSNLFAIDVNHFVSQHQKFKSLNHQIQEFFNLSNRILYTNLHQDNSELLLKLISISKNLRDCERGV